MPNLGSLIGGLLQNNMPSSGTKRIDTALSSLSRGSTASPSGTNQDMFGEVGAFLRNGLQSAQDNPAMAGGIGAVLGAVLGGGSRRSALGGGAIALLASVAMKALTDSGQLPSGNAADRDQGDVPLGLRPPATPEEKEALQHTAELVLRGMVYAAKSDGQISPEESQRILERLQSADDLDQDSQHWLMNELQKPMDLQAFAAEIPNVEVAAEIYAASLLAVEVDTDAERQYLAEFARLTGLQPATVEKIHQAMGVTI